jgi:hypothetical protein
VRGRPTASMRSCGRKQYNNVGIAVWVSFEVWAVGGGVRWGRWWPGGVVGLLPQYDCNTRRLHYNPLDNKVRQAGSIVLRPSSLCNCSKVCNRAQQAGIINTVLWMQARRAAIQLSVLQINAPSGCGGAGGGDRGSN